MSRKKITSEEDLVDLIASGELDHDEDSGRYMECPRCGSETWAWLKTNKRGKTTGCDECREIEDN